MCNDVRFGSFVFILLNLFTEWRGLLLTTDISDDAVSVQIAAPPQDGEANAEIISYFSKIFQIRKSDLSIKVCKKQAHIKFMCYKQSACISKFQIVS